MATKSFSRCLRLNQALKSNPKRFYHSYDHPPPAGPFNAIETTILSAATPHISSHGFTHTTLVLGAKDAGYIDASTNLFPKGAFTLVHYHLYTQRLALAKRQQAMKNKQEDSLDVGAKVKALTWERLMGNKEIIHRWQEALALMAQPFHIPTSIFELSSLADEICFLAGDGAVDTRWYTKRASISTTYAATELFMTTDKSPQYTDTKEFLERRFRDAQLIGDAVKNVGVWAGFTAQAGLNVLRSKGVRV